MRVSKLRLAIPAAACAVGLAFGTGVAGAATPTVKVTPSKHLAGGQTVTVTWKGFKPKKRDAAFVLVECTKAVLDDGDSAHCDLDNVALLDPAKSGTTPFTIAAGTIGDGTCGTVKSDLKNCLLTAAIIDGTNTPEPGQDVTVPIAFTLPQ